MSHKKKPPGPGTESADVTTATGNTPQKRVNKEISAANDALDQAANYLGSENWTWIELAQMLKRAADAATAAWGCASRESLRPPNPPATTQEA